MYKEFDDIQNNENVKLAEAYLKNIPIIDVPNWTKELANNQPAINSSIIMLGKAMTAVMSESGSTKNIVASCGSVLEKLQKHKVNMQHLTIVFINQWKHFNRFLQKQKKWLMHL